MSSAGKQAGKPESGFKRWYWGLLRGHKPSIAWLILVSLVHAAAVGIASPILILKITDEGVVKKDVQALLFFALVAMLVLLVNALARYFLRIKRTRLRNALVEEVSVRMLRDFYRLPYKSVLQKDKGYYISRIFDEAPRAVEPLLQIVVDMSIITLSMLASLVLVAALSWRSALLVAIGVPAFHLINRRISAGIRETWKQASETEALAKGVLERLVGAYRVVNIFKLHKKADESYTRALLRQLQHLLAHNRFIAMFWSLGAGYINWSYIGVIALSGYEVIQDRLTLGGMIAIANIYSRMIGYAQQLTTALPNLQTAKVTFERLAEFRTEAEKHPPLPASADGVAVQGMGFAYDSEEICTDLSLNIRKGERVLVVGSNGTGKTTLAHVLAGLLRPTSGTVRSPSIDRISAAFFPPVFIPGDIGENIGLQELSSEQRERFEEMARAFEIEGLIGEDPKELSAGQRQKVSILRALLKDADLYIFDEPFSNVDSKTKDALFQTLLDATRGKSLLLILHGEEHLHSHFDKVIDLDEAGSHLSQGSSKPKAEAVPAAPE